MKILVTGSRAWPYSLEDLGGMVMFHNAMRAVLDGANQWDREYDMPTGHVLVVVGDCPTGLDAIARNWCANNWVPYDMHIARWDLYDKAAGPIRNQEMVDTRPDVCVGFPRPGEKNKGTLGCMLLAKRADIQVIDGTAIA